MNAPVNDHLGLLERSLASLQMIVFTGMSGSGKSTCIDLLLAEHPDFAGRDYTTIGPTPITWPEADPPTELVVVDELQRFGELRHVTRLLRGGHTLLVASHLHPAWVRFFNMRWPADHFYTDRSTDKLQRFLEWHGVRFTPERVREFGQTYGANYTDLEIILEYSGGEDFDLAFERFRRSAWIERDGGRPADQAP
jgi:hypothetical protein